MMVTVRMMRNAAAMDVDISARLHIEVFILYWCVGQLALLFFQSLWVFCHGFCMSAEPEKPGLCPKNLEIALLGDCAEKCSHDSDCPNDEKCCSKGCEHQCTPPHKGICYIDAWVTNTCMWVRAHRFFFF